MIQTQAYKDLSEKELLLLMANGVTEAFSVIYQRYWEELYTLASKMLRNETAAADILQDVFLSLWRRRTELAIEGSLDAYLHNSIRYKVRDFIAKNITQRDYLLLLTNTAIQTIPPSSQLRLELKEAQQIISQTVAQMPPRVHQAYILRREQDLSYKEIGAIMGVAPETARKQVQQALQLIKLALGNSVGGILLSIIS